MMVRTILAGAVLMLAAGAADAQITTYIAPARPLAESREMIAATESARRDSTTRTAMTNMKAWVDSAAGITIPASVGAIDSAALANDPGRPITTFSHGAVAPATASMLPALALAGIIAVAAGLLILRTRQRE